MIRQTLIHIIMGAQTFWFEESPHTAVKLDCHLQSCATLYVLVQLQCHLITFILFLIEKWRFSNYYYFFFINKMVNQFLIYSAISILLE